jgi:hypothetical protein
MRRSKRRLVEKECVWAWSYVPKNGYNIKGMRAKTDLRGVRQVIRGNSVVMLEVWIPEPALFFLSTAIREHKRLFLAPKEKSLVSLIVPLYHYRS